MTTNANLNFETHDDIWPVFFFFFSPIEFNLIAFVDANVDGFVAIVAVFRYIIG